MTRYPRKFDTLRADIKARYTEAREADDDHSFYSMSEGNTVSVIAQELAKIELSAELTEKSMLPLRQMYAESHRHYHTWKHVESCRAILDKFDSSTHERSLTNREYRIIDEALIWHDAVYDPTAKFGRNELQSALLAYEFSTGVLSDEEREEVVRLILLTSGHRVQPDDRLGAILVSIDLAILGSEPEEYAEYAANVRAEYAHVPDEVWAVRRKAFLKSMLKEGVLIFPNPYIGKYLEDKARSNLLAEYERLSLV